MSNSHSKSETEVKTEREEIDFKDGKLELLKDLELIPYKLCKKVVWIREVTTDCTTDIYYNVQDTERH